MAIATGLFAVGGSSFTSLRFSDRDPLFPFRYRRARFECSFIRAATRRSKFLGNLWKTGKISLDVACQTSARALVSRRDLQRSAWRSKGIMCRGDKADTPRGALTMAMLIELLPQWRMISFSWRRVSAAPCVPTMCTDAINARVKPVSRSSSILRYATFLGGPWRR